MQLTLATIILYLQINGGMMSSIFNIYNKCQCGDLIYESECEQHLECYYNNQCHSRSCNELTTNRQCLRNLKCGWDEDKCSEFESCTKFTEFINCTNHNYKCKYDIITKTCNTNDKVYQKTCSETSASYCYYGIDGICYESNGKCQKLNECEDVKYDDIACSLAQDYCYANAVTKKCESLIGCKNIKQKNCKFAAQEVGGSNFYICQYGDDEQCEDWDVSEQSIKTCHSESLGYYHWKLKSCEVCSSLYGYLTIQLMINIVLFLVL